MQFAPYLSRVLSAVSWSDLLPILLIVLALRGAHRAPQSRFFDDPLNKEQGLALRGIFSCVVMMAHLSLYAGGLFFPRFRYWSELAVSVFFGLSGYGLMVQAHKSPGYMDHFWNKRLSALVWPYLVMGTLGILQISRDHVWWPTFGPIGGDWFCFVLILFYIAFWLGHCGKERQIGLQATRTCLWVAWIIIVLGCWQKDKPFTFMSGGSFAMGVLLGTDTHTVWDILKANGRTIAIATGIIILMHIHYGMFALHAIPESNPPRFLLNSFFVVSMAAWGLKCQMGNRILSWLGTISYELYLSHGWVMHEIRHWWPSLSGDGYVYSVVVVSLAMAASVHGLVDWVRKLLSGKQQLFVRQKRHR